MPAKRYLFTIHQQPFESLSVDSWYEIELPIIRETAEKITDAEKAIQSALVFMKIRSRFNNSIHPGIFQVNLPPGRDIGVDEMTNLLVSYSDAGTLDEFLKQAKVL